MHTVSALISTSVSDARTSLSYDLQSNPIGTAHTALRLLERLKGKEGQAQRRQLAATTLRKAAKAIAEDETRSPQGPGSADMYANLPAADLRNVLACRVESDPVSAETEMLATLADIRGEEGQGTRRKILVGAIGKAAKTLAQQEKEPEA
ncbi:hypothetical protein [Billgrantia gudaonensis]|uniref:Uncharacterized protein n=1 Tax=Billgrantia gudaonensis TaxID=376427 RepID=A0A1G8XFR9_9GAMM|nr:hypothetical protein [Halomonas gudaonensis]SDJ89321.1 hypothetical protein SAMN04487954_10925 [Halomonas gudaonensis]